MRNRTNARNTRILDILRTGPETASGFAMNLGCPEASVRRSIQELRADGHNISFAGAQSGLYRLGEYVDNTAVQASAAPEAAL